jgi:hypothetical protein
MADKVFCDPIHRHILFEDAHRFLFLALLDTPEFQRLRRIRQLGVSCLTYPGAEHSRLSHALGTFHIMTHALHALRRNQPDVDIPDEVRLAARCAALLHDIGHGPFSHLTERASPVTHEEFTARFIREDTATKAALARYSTQFPELVAALLLGENPELQHISALLSSELDVDRMDYLLRDAHFCGVPFGVYDYHRILHTMRLATIPGKGTWQPLWLEKGKHAVEQMLYARYHMYWTVYYHPTTCGFEAVYVAILRRAKEVAERITFLPAVRNLLDGKVTPQDYLRLDDATVLAQISLWRAAPDPVLADLCGRFLDRRGFKPIGPVRIDVANVGCVGEAERFLDQQGLPHESYLLSRKLVAIGYKYYTPDPEAQKGVFLLEGEGPVEVSRRMPGVQALIEAPSQEDFYYAPREHAASIAAILRPLLRA